jgi:hypothetical protein
MAKQKKKESQTVYTVLVGFDVPEGRWEIGGTFAEGDISADGVKALLEMGAIEVKE